MKSPNITVLILTTAAVLGLAVVLFSLSYLRADLATVEPVSGGQAMLSETSAAPLPDSDRRVAITEVRVEDVLTGQGGGNATSGPIIRLVDETNMPISSARVLLRSGTADRVVGETDGGGELMLDKGLTCDYVVAVHPDYILHKEFGGRLDPRGVIRMVLAPAARIEGTVRNALSGDPVGAGIQVYARPSNRFFLNAQDFALAGRASEAVPCSTTDEGGHFSISSLDPKVEYSLVAAGQGLFSGWDYKSIRAGATGVDVLMNTLYALHFEFDSPLGAAALPVDWSKRDESSHFISFALQGDARAVYVNDLVARLAGREFSTDQEIENLLLWQSKSPAERLGPWHLISSFPGYKPAEFDVYATPLDSRFETTRLPLEPLVESFGAIRVRASNSPEGMQQADDELLAGVLHLASTGGDFKVALTFGALRDGQTLKGIPHGEYRARFVGNRGLYRFPVVGKAYPDGVLHLRVTDESGTLDLNLSGAAGIELELLGADGWPSIDRAGFLPIYSRPGRENEGALFSRGTVNTRLSSFGERPFVLVAPGKYQLDPIRSIVSLEPAIDVNAQGDLLRPVRVTLQAGESVKLVWQELSMSEVRPPKQSR